MESDKTIKSFKSLGEAMGMAANNQAEDNNFSSKGRVGLAPNRNSPATTTSPANQKETVQNPLKNERGEDLNPVDAGRELLERNCKPGKNGLYSPISTSQLRKVLSAVLVIQNEIEQKNIVRDELPLEISLRIKYLEARLAYQAGRDEGRNYRDKLFIPLIHAVKEIGNSYNKFKRFAVMMETIVAYHKFYGGKN